MTTRALGDRGTAVLPLLFGATLFLSSALLFVVQPIVAKMLLPLLGGAPVVWNTALVFFQAMLLAGYLYAHGLSWFATLRRQTAIHLFLLAAVLLALPVAVPGGWTPPGTDNPVPWLIAVLAAMVGAPFFVVSASAPLLQRWFSHSGHRDAANPYFLYAASNLGGLAALLAYPLLFERVLGLHEQNWSWAAGYVALALLTLACALALFPRHRAMAPDAPAELASAAAAAAADPGAATSEAPPMSRTVERLRWVALAFVPSSLLVGVTTFLTTDIASIPFLWVVPLALYLMTFVIVFARHPIISHGGIVALQPVLVLPLVLWFFWRYEHDVAVIFAVHLVGFFGAALACHSTLAHTRPPVARLTEFYLFLSLGGVLGGAFNALAAPLLFEGVIEYPLGILFACLLLPGAPPATAIMRHPVVGPALRLLLLVALFALVIYLLDRRLTLDLYLEAAGLAGVALLIYALARQPAYYGAAVLLTLFVGLVADIGGGDGSRLLYQARSYFGVYKVERDGSYIRLSHGTTIHGAQSTQPDERLVPGTYYHREGPIGQFFAAYRDDPRPRRVAIVGLGAGTLLCYGRPGEHWTYYEIDPTVLRIASDTRYFTYMRDCPPRHDVVLGDARVTLEKAPDGQFDLIVLDAFSSDAIPIHLITREAIRLYMAKLKPDGVVAVHISNRHLDLEPPLGRLARDLNLAGLVQLESAADVSHDEDQEGFVFESDWVLLSRTAASFGRLVHDNRWRPPRTTPGVSVWTDDFSNVLETIDWFD